jgi:mannosylglucosylglycerate synthase
MKRLNIALLHYSCPPVIGGVEKVVQQQANLLLRNFHNVKVLAGTGELFTQRLPVEINPMLGSRSIEVQEAHKSCLNGDMTRLNKLTDKIYKFLCSSLADFDMVIAHNVVSMHFNLALTKGIHNLASKHPVKVVAWNHDSPYFREDYPSYLDEEPWAILKKTHPKIHYATISYDRKKRFQNLYQTDTKITVIPDGIDPFDFFKLHRTTMEIIKEKSLFNADLIFVQPSRLIPRKNIELSIKVLKAVRDRGVDAKFLLSGAYDPHESQAKKYYLNLKKLARSLKVDKDLIVLADYILKTSQRIRPDQIFIHDFYMLADLLFLPSIDEGFGLPLLEAGMIKLPIVCSRIEPFQEIGMDDVCCFNLDDSPEKIADKILNFLEKIPTHNMYRKVIKNYVWDTIYDTSMYPFLADICSDEREDGEVL